MAAIDKLGLKAKLSFSFGLQLLFIGILGAVGFVSLGKVTTTFQHVVEVNMPKEKLLSEFRMAQKDLIIAAQTAVGAEGSAQALDDLAKTADDVNERFAKSAAKFDALPSAAAENETWNQVHGNWKPLYDLTRKIIDASRSTEPENVLKRDKMLKIDFEVARKNMRTPVEALREFQVVDSEKWSTSAEETAKRTKWVMLFSGLLGLLLGASGAIYLTLNLHRLLTRITRELSQGADEVASAAKQISESSDELSSSVTEQASSIQETSAAIEEISSMIAKTSDNAANSQRLSEASQETVRDGQNQVQRMLAAIEEIDRGNAVIGSEIDRSNQEFHEIIKVISEIGVKTQVINDIVFQTKLLSFNASVEAARAGEHGKGFAVVAEEVGNLAQMSGNAAKEITAMLEGSISKVEGMVKASTSRIEGHVRAGKEKVNAGMETARSCDQTFQNIVLKTNQVKDLIAEISSATQEQSIGVSEVSKAVVQMDETTQQNNVVSQKSATFAQQLNAQADGLASLVSELVVAVEGASSRPEKTTHLSVVPNARHDASDTDTERDVA